MSYRVKWYYYFIILFLVSCGGSEKDKTAEKEESKIEREASAGSEVGVVQIEYGDFLQQVVSNGKLRSPQKAELFFKSSGSILQLYCKNGEKVKFNQLLAILDTLKAGFELSEAETALQTAYVDLQDKLLSRGKNSLKDTANLPKEALAYLKNASGLSRAILQKKRAEMNYQNCFLRAPFSGVIANVEKQAFDQVSGNNPFCILINNSQFNVDFQVLESELISLGAGQELKIAPFANSQLSFKATIISINPFVDEHGLVKVAAKIEKPKKLFEGENVKVYLEKVVPNQFVMPKEALVLRNNRAVVFLYKSGLAKWIYVEKLFENDKLISVKGELFQGDSVIVHNNLNLAHDAQVKLSSEVK